MPVEGGPEQDRSPSWVRPPSGARSGSEPPPAYERGSQPEQRRPLPERGTPPGRSPQLARRGSEHDWLDAEAGPVVRPYTVTGGRVRPARSGLDLVAFVVAGPPPASDRRSRLHPEHHRILAQSQRPISVAELATGLDLALGVLRVLLGDLLTAGLIAMYEPPASSHSPDDDMLKAVLNGLRAL